MEINYIRITYREDKNALNVPDSPARLACR